MVEELGNGNLEIKKYFINKPEFGISKNGTIGYNYLTTQHKGGYPIIFTIFKTKKVDSIDSYGHDLETMDYCIKQTIYNTKY